LLLSAISGVVVVAPEDGQGGEQAVEVGVAALEVALGGGRRALAYRRLAAARGTGATCGAGGA
jgi:hypothetical protein